MPWCAECDRFLSPSTVHPDGSCPRCGRAVEPGRARPPADVVTGPDEDLGPVPWHFKVFLAAASLYLGWRVVQVVGWFT